VLPLQSPFPSGFSSGGGLSGHPWEGLVARGGAGEVRPLVHSPYTVQYCTVQYCTSVVQGTVPWYTQPPLSSTSHHCKMGTPGTPSVLYSTLLLCTIVHHCTQCVTFCAGVGGPGGAPGTPALRVSFGFAGAPGECFSGGQWRSQRGGGCK